MIKHGKLTITFTNANGFPIDKYYTNYHINLVEQQ